MKMHLTMSAGVVLAVACGSGAARAATLHVNGACGDDAWSGATSICAAPDGPKATIQAAIDASADGDEILVAPGTYPEHLGFPATDVAVRSTDGAAATVIDGQDSGRVLTFGSSNSPKTLVQGFTITRGFATVGGAMVNYSSPTIRNCLFIDNHAQVVTCIRNYQGSPLIEGCEFAGNSSSPDGTIGNGPGQPVYRNCIFRDNIGQVLNFSASNGSPSFVNCKFIDNVGGLGGATVDGGSSLWVNCSFSGNHGTGPLTSSFDAASNSTLINCTMNGSVGEGLVVDAGGAQVTLVNSIIWGSGSNSIHVYNGLQPNVTHSNIAGGWPGPHNINADPLFVQPGTHDLRLSFGSPCLNAGDTAALPPDVFDLDGDGDTAEQLPIDLAGAARVVDGVVDMGAYEGEFPPGSLADSVGDLDQGEIALLVPEGGVLNPLVHPTVFLINVSGGNNGWAVVTQHDGAVHAGAGGFSAMGSMLALETSLAEGTFRATVMVPFDAQALNGAAPQQVRATWYDAAAGSWALAVASNAGNSPGFAGPIGERFYAEAPAGWGFTQEVGDYGVYWDPQSGMGFAWANVDHTSDFSAGLSSCPADCVQSPDGQVSVVDMLRLISDWGVSSTGPCDVDSDGAIGVQDLMALLGTWGPCTAPASAGGGQAGAAPAGSADIDGNGSVDFDDLEMLRSCMGSNEPGCAADFDHDGSVGARDYLHLLAQWGPDAVAP